MEEEQVGRESPPPEEEQVGRQSTPSEEEQVGRESPPPEVEALARDRAAARGRRDWATADALRARIEGSGWKIVDHGTGFALVLAHPPDRIDGGRRLYGSSAAVPSRVGEPTTGLAGVVVLAGRWPDDLARTLAALRTHVPSGTQVIVVVDDPSPEQATQLDDPTGPAAAPIGGEPVEQVWTSAPLGFATATNMGLRRVAAEIAMLLDTSIEPTGDFVTGLVGALERPDVAVVGAGGRVSGDLRHFEDAPPGDVDVVDGTCQAFRRVDYAARGPLDERIRSRDSLDVWWSLVLRDEGEAHPPRRAVRLADLPLARRPRRPDPGSTGDDRSRLARRDFYRIVDRFGGRSDLLLHPRPRRPSEA